MKFQLTSVCNDTKEYFDRLKKEGIKVDNFRLTKYKEEICDVEINTLEEFFKVKEIICQDLILMKNSENQDVIRVYDGFNE